jgi:hypothetical protein
LYLNEIKQSRSVDFAKSHNPFIKCNQIHSVYKTDGEEAIQSFLTFDLIAVELIKIGQVRKSMVIDHGLKNFHTKFEIIPCMCNTRRPLQSVDLFMPIEVGQ